MEKQQDVFLPPYTVYGLEMDFEANKYGQVPLHTHFLLHFPALQDS